MKEEKNDPTQFEKIEVSLVIENEEGEDENLTCITNELTGNQDQAIANLFSNESISAVWKAILSSTRYDDPTLAGKDAVVGLVSALKGNAILEFLSIILVPKDKPVYREEIAKKIKKGAGDLTNTKITEVVLSFFAKNSNSLERLGNYLNLNLVSQIQEKIVKKTAGLEKKKK